MFITNYKATLKTVFRSPLILIAFGAMLIMSYALHSGTMLTVASGYGYNYNLRVLRTQIWGCHSVWTIVQVIPVFAGMMVSTHILSDIRNGFGDLLVSSRKSILGIFLSKLCVIATVTLAARLLLLCLNLVYFWCVFYPEKYIPDGVFLPLGEILAAYAASEAIFVPFMLLCYIAMPTFVCAITNIPASGAVWNAGFYLAASVYTPFKSSDFYLPPLSTWRYYSVFDTIDDPQFMENLQAGRLVDCTGMFPPTFTKALMVYIAWIVFSVVLLIASYFILKRKYRT